MFRSKPTVCSIWIFLRVSVCSLSDWLSVDQIFYLYYFILFVVFSPVTEMNIFTVTVCDDKEQMFGSVVWRTYVSVHTNTVRNVHCWVNHQTNSIFFKHILGDFGLVQVVPISVRKFLVSLSLISVSDKLFSCWTNETNLDSASVLSFNLQCVQQSQVSHHNLLIWCFI